MNIAGNLFKIFNEAKLQSSKWDSQLEEEFSDGEITGMTGYAAAYYGGARDALKIFLKVYNGEMNDIEVDKVLRIFSNPKWEIKAN